MPPAELELLRDRVGTFQQAVRAHEPSAALCLGNDEINVLISTELQLRPLKNRVYVHNEGTQLKGWVSFPLGQLGASSLHNRYVNGFGEFKVLLRNGALVVSLEKLTVKGKPVPEWLMKRVRKRNLAEEINKDPRAAVAIERLDAIQVRDGRLVIVPKAD
jgi:hypothetical protein